MFLKWPYRDTFEKGSRQEQTMNKKTQDLTLIAMRVPNGLLIEIDAISEQTAENRSVVIRRAVRELIERERGVSSTPAGRMSR